MKKLILCLLVGLAAPAAVAQFRIDWFKVAGGGATSTGGVYGVSGTVGQFDAETATGGQFDLVGGYWSLIAGVPTPGAPSLTITSTATMTVLICWPSPSTGFELQENADLSTTNWVKVAQTPTDNGTIKCVTVGPVAHNVFYRLNK